MSEQHPLDLRIVDKDAGVVATVDQLREQAADAIRSSDRFLVTWDDGEGGVTYTGYAGDTGGDAVAFFGYTAARALLTFAQILEADPAKAAEAVVAIVEEMMSE